jgi:hypothetical protein
MKKGCPEVEPSLIRRVEFNKSSSEVRQHLSIDEFYKSSPEVEENLKKKKS